MMQYHNYSLTELEDMLPWEREVYVGLLMNYIEEDNERQKMVDYIATINSEIGVHPIPKTEEKMGPYSFIPFLNNLAIMHKVKKAMEQ